jgi:hypothetical protein
LSKESAPGTALGIEFAFSTSGTMMHLLTLKFCTHLVKQDIAPRAAALEKKSFHLSHQHHTWHWHGYLSTIKLCIKMHDIILQMHFIANSLVEKMHYLPQLKDSYP